MKNPVSQLVRRLPGGVTLARVVALGLGLSILPPKGRAVDVLTQHNDQFRTGANLSETTLTTAKVNAANFGKLFSYAVEGYVYAQPLHVSGLAIAGGTHDVVFVATMADSVYAFDADANVKYWQKTFTGGTITTVPVADIAGSPNLNIHGNVGILSTPVIDKASSTLYVLARTKDTGNDTYQQKLHALDLATGNEKFGGPVTIAAKSFNSKMQNQRPALGLSGGKIYICWGSHEDITPYNGWIMAYDATTLAQTYALNLTAGGSKGAIWQAGQAPAFDSSGSVYVTTGNGDWNGTTQWGQTCLKLSPALAVEDWFTLNNYASLNVNDTDFGAGGCLLLPKTSGYPATSYVVTGGKEGKIFVLDKNSGDMGKRTNGDAGAHQFWQAVKIGGCSYHIHGTPVYWNSATQGPMIYVWGENDVGRAFKFNGSTFTTTAFSHTAVKSPTTGCGMPGSILSLSANGGSNGIVWANCVYTGDAVHDIVPGILRAYDANNLGTELWNSYENKARDDFGTLAKYVAPTIADGKVYMASFSNTVCVYGELGADGPIADGTYKLVNRNSNPLVLGVAGKNNTVNSANTEQEDYKAANSQKWVVTYLGNGVYKIVGAGPGGDALDVTGQSVANGALIDVYPYRSQANQQWMIEPSGVAGYYTISGAQSGLVLDVIGAETNARTGVQQWPSKGGANQLWSFQVP